MQPSLLLSTWQSSFHFFPDCPNLWAKHLSVKELELDVELRSFHYIFWCFSSTKEAPIEILCSVTFDLRKSHFSSVPEFVAVGENDNEFLLGEWPKMLMTPLITLKLLFLDSNTYPDICLIDCSYFGGREIAISFELTISPRNSISWTGVITHFSDL